MTSARPLETAFSVEYRWNTRTGSSELSTVTDEPSLILLVLAAIAASATSAADSGMSSVWCSPIPKKSTPACSAKTPSSTTSLIACACETRCPSSSFVVSPNVFSPNTSGNPPAANSAAMPTASC